VYFKNVKKIKIWNWKNDNTLATYKLKAESSLNMIVTISSFSLFAFQNYPWMVKHYLNELSLQFKAFTCNFKINRAKRTKKFLELNINLIFSKSFIIIISWTKIIKYLCNISTLPNGSGSDMERLSTFMVMNKGKKVITSKIACFRLV